MEEDSDDDEIEFNENIHHITSQTIINSIKKSIYLIILILHLKMLYLQASWTQDLKKCMGGLMTYKILQYLH